MIATLQPLLRQSLFVAGTDTGVGKTWVSVQLLRSLAGSGLRVAGMKPVAAGVVAGAPALVNDDALQLQAAGNVDLPYELVNPCCLPEPTSPHLAAERAGKSVDIARIVASYDSISRQSDVILVESAGGWLAPIGPPAIPGTAGPTMQDVALALRLPVLLVVGIRLGCLSHALLTVAAIRACGLDLAGWIANPIDPEFADRDAYVVSLQRRLTAPMLWRTDASS
jgi:dethiobiotin synthetase